MRKNYIVLTVTTLIFAAILTSITSYLCLSQEPFIPITNQAFMGISFGQTFISKNESNYLPIVNSKFDIHNLNTINSLKKLTETKFENNISFGAFSKYIVESHVLLDTEDNLNGDFQYKIPLIIAGIMLVLILISNMFQNKYILLGLVLFFL